jgi:hypothetical protein
MPPPLGFSSPIPGVGDAFISPLWVTGSVYTGGSLYVLLACTGFFLAAIEWTSSKKASGEWKLRLIALVLIFLLCAIECVFWFCLGSTCWAIGPLYYALALAPQVLYCVLLFLCMYLFGSIFYQVYFTSVLSDYEITLRAQRRAKIQVTVSIVSIVMAVALYAMSFALPTVLYETVQANMMGGVNLMAGVSFPVYLAYLYWRRHSLGAGRARYQHRLLQCLTVTLLMSCCAVARGIIVLMWRQMALSFAREVFWCFSVCSYALCEMLPIAWLLVLFKVIPLNSNYVLVGTPDAEYWINRSSQSVMGHDFFVINNGPVETTSSSGDDSQPSSSDERRLKRDQ